MLRVGKEKVKIALRQGKVQINHDAAIPWPRQATHGAGQATHIGKLHPSKLRMASYTQSKLRASYAQCQLHK